MDFLENDAVRNEWRESETALYSIAISLKRIADALEGSPEKMGLADNIGACVADALHDASQRFSP